MNAANKKFGLGRGLEALLGTDEVKFELSSDNDVEEFVKNTVFNGEMSEEIPINDVEPCKFQPRTEFNKEALQSLADSIKEKGVLQPLLVRRKGKKFEIIAGERRWRAAKMVGLKTVPALVRKLSDQETLEIALIENLQRENLSAIEEAEGLNRLMTEYAYTQDNLSKVIGKSRSYIANSVRLLVLPDEVRAMVKENKLSASHARALVGHPYACELAQKIIAKDLSVRETEKLISNYKNKVSIPRVPRFTDLDLKKIKADLEKRLNLKVNITAYRNGKGSVTLKYNSPVELSAILDILEQR